MYKKICRLLGIMLIPVCLTLASCDTGPKDPGEMLKLVLRDCSSKPEKAMTAFKKSGQEGQTALIRVFFNIKVEGESYYENNRGYELDSSDFAAFVETLSEDPEFLRAILAVSDAWPRDPCPSERKVATLSPNPVKKRPNELEWVLARDEGIYTTWIATLSIRDPRLLTAWELYIARHPDKGLDAFLTMLARLPIETTYGDSRYLEKAIERFAPPPGALTPAQLRLIFTNNMEARLLHSWKPDPKAWLLAFPEDLGFALWRDEIETRQLAFAIPLETLRDKQITQERGKALIFFSEPDGELCLSAQLMRKTLTKESAANSLYLYDRRIEVFLFRTRLFSYFADVTMPNSPSRISGVRSDLAVSCRDSKSGEEFWTKHFDGGEPPEKTGVPAGGVRYVSGSVPWEEAYTAIRECLAH